MNPPSWETPAKTRRLSTKERFARISVITFITIKTVDYCSEEKPFRKDRQIKLVEQ